VEDVGEGVAALQDVVDGKHPFCQALAQAERPAIVVGSGVFEREDAGAVLPLLGSLATLAGVLKPEEGWNGYNVLAKSAGRTGGLDLGLVNLKGRKVSPTSPKLVFNMGADEYSGPIPDDAFVVYQGSHGDAGASRADVILPATAYTETAGMWVNTEGRAQVSKAAVVGPGLAKPDWTILRALSEVMGLTLPYDDLAGVRDRAAQVQESLNPCCDCLK